MPASPTSDLAAKGISGAWEEVPGQMPDGAVIIAAITSCTNTSNPRNVIAAGLLARNANRLGLTRKPWVKSSLAPGSKTVALYLDETGLMSELEAARFRRRRLRLHHLQRHVRRTGSGDPAGDHRPRPVRHCRVVRQPQLRRPDSPVRQAGLPRFAAAGRGLRDRRYHPFRYREGCAGRGGWQGNPPERHLAERRRNRRGGQGIGEAGTVPQRLHPDVRHARGARPESGAAVRLASEEHLHPPSAVLGRRTGRRAPAHGHASAGGAAGQHHHRPPVAFQRDHARQRRRRIPGENGPAGRGLQLLRHPSRRPPDRAARHLRQSETVQRNGAQRTAG